MLKLSDYFIKVHHNLKETPQNTVVEVVDNKGKAYGKGVAVVGSSDQYSRKVGRKIAFKRALIDSGISKEARSDMWASYLTKSYIIVRQEVEV